MHTLTRNARKVSCFKCYWDEKLRSRDSRQAEIDFLEHGTVSLLTKLLFIGLWNAVRLAPELELLQMEISLDRAGVFLIEKLEFLIYATIPRWMNCLI